MIVIHLDDDGLADRLALLGRAIPDALADMAGVLAQRLKDEIGSSLPDGPLARSVSIDLERTPSGVLAGLENDLPYAAFQNEGYRGTEQVSAHLRSVSVAFGRSFAPPVEALVRAHSRHVDYAGTGFMSRPFAAMSDDIATGFADAVAREFDS